MDIQDMRIFQRVAILQNLSAVGAELGLTPGTISKRIQALEDELGVRLFDRTTRSIRITEEGETLRGHVDAILEHIEVARSSVGEKAASPRGVLKISAPASLAPQFVTPAILEFMAAFPQITVQIDLTDRIVSLHENGYDVAIRTGTLSESRLIAKRLLTDRIVLAASPGYVTLHGSPKQPKDLAAHNCLVHGDRMAWHFKSGEAVTEVRVSGTLRSNNGNMLRDAALKGLGIIRTSELRVMRELSEGRLIRLMPEQEVATSTAIWAVYPSNKHVLPRLRVFLDFVARWFAAERQKLTKSGRGPPDKNGQEGEREAVDEQEARLRPAVGRRSKSQKGSESGAAED